MRLGSITAMLPVLLMLSGRGVHGQETSAALRAGVEVSRPLPADSIHTCTLSASEGQLVRLHIEPFPRMFFVRVLDGSGAAGGLPGEHVGDRVRVEQAPASEEAEHAALEGALEGVGVVGVEVRRLMEADGAVALLGEEAVEDHEVKVEVGVEGGAEAVQEGDGAQLGLRPGAGAAGAGRGR